MIGGAATASPTHLVRDPLTETGKSVRWGIIGGGGVARKVVADLHLLPDAQVVAVAGRSPERVREFATHFSLPISFAGVDAPVKLASRTDIDVVYIATPHNNHAEHAALALSAGKHVLVEKPFTVTAAEAAALIALARDSGLFLMEAMWTRFLPSVQRALGIIHSDELGAPFRVTADLGFPVPYRPSARVWNPDTAGGALLEMGSYPLTWAMSVFEEPVAVTARSLFADNGVESQTSVTLDYFGGGSADLTASFLSFGPSEATVVGSRGWLRTARSLHSPQSFVVSFVDGSTVDYVIPHIGNGYAYELREVMTCIHIGGRESRLMPLAESLATMKIIDEVRRQTISHE